MEYLFTRDSHSGEASSLRVELIGSSLSMKGPLVAEKEEGFTISG